jgi:hypothetical protein
VGREGDHRASLIGRFLLQVVVDDGGRSETRIVVFAFRHPEDCSKVKEKTCAYRKSSPGILVMQSTQAARASATTFLNWS